MPTTPSRVSLPLSGWAIAHPSADRRLLGLARAQRPRLRLVQRVGEAVDPADADALLQGSVAAGPHSGAPGLAADALHSGLHDELQERVAIEVGPDRLTEPAHRALHALALLRQVGEALLELQGHLVELLAQRGELVVAHRGHAGREVAAAQAASGVQQLHDLTAQRAGHREGEGHREHEEAGQDPAGDDAALHDPARRLGLRREDRHAYSRADHPGSAERRVAEVAAADRQLPALAQRPRGRLLERRRDPRVADPHHHPVGARRAADRCGVGRRVLDGDLQLAEAARPPGVDELARRGGDRRLRADVEDRRAVADEHDAPRPLGPQERLRAQPRGGQVVVLERRGELLVGRDALQRRTRARARVAVHVDRHHLLGGQTRVGLAVLVVGDQAEQDDRHRDHGDDHDQDEEEGEAVAEAHPSGLHRPIHRAQCGLQPPLRAGRTSP